MEGRKKSEGFPAEPPRVCVPNGQGAIIASAVCQPGVWAGGSRLADFDRGFLAPATHPQPD